jgi:RND family efflux transporter MFP subunit
MVQWIRLPIACSVVAGLAASGCSQPKAVGVTNDAPIVAVAKVVSGDVAHVISVAAEFRPFQEIDVHAKVAGYLKTIAVDVGDRVRAGQLLAVLEVPELRDEMRQDEAAVKRAKEDMNRAQADLERMESAHQVAHLGSTRLAGVLKARPNLVAQQDIDEAAARDRMAEAQVATAKAAMASAQEQLEVARAVESKTKTLFGYTEITAPFTGVITHRYADTGAMIQAGTSSQTQTMPIVKLSQNNVLRLVIPVPESAVSRIRTGTPVDLEVQALNRTFTGSVARVADRLDTETRTMRVEVDVENPRFELVPGMFANASLVLDAAKHVPVIPVQALDRSGRDSRVLVVTAERRIEVRPVTLGLEADDRVEVKRGLTVDEIVVVGSRAQLKAGTMVVPKQMNAAAAAVETR